MVIRKIIKAGRDFIIPILDKLPTEDLEKQLKDAKDKFPVWTRAQCEQFGQILYENVITISESEDRRRNNIDARLQPILGLISIVASVFLGIVGILSSKDLAEYTTLSICSLYFGGVYILIQFVFAFYYAVKGLSLRSYRETRSLFPQTNETTNEYRVRFANQLFLDAIYNTEQNNDKASYLKCVHACLRNAFIGVVCIVLILIAIGVFRYL